MVAAQQSRGLCCKEDLPLPGLQDECQEGGALHHWSLHKLCAIYRNPHRQIGESLDQSGRGKSVSVG